MKAGNAGRQPQMMPQAISAVLGASQLEEQAGITDKYIIVETPTSRDPGNTSPTSHLGHASFG